jgi:hypothetical protein
VIAMRAALTCLIVLVALAGCRKEPTIVIKFEPNDLASVAPAAVAGDAASPPATVADAAAGAEAPQPAAPAGPPECKKPADCEVIPVECCGCNAGGAQMAVPKARVAALKKERAKKCKGTVCAQMMSQDPSCLQVPTCKDGRCVLIMPM